MEKRGVADNIFHDITPSITVEIFVILYFVDSVKPAIYDYSYVPIILFFMKGHKTQVDFNAEGHADASNYGQKWNRPLTLGDG